MSLVINILQYDARYIQRQINCHLVYTDQNHYSVLSNVQNGGSMQLCVRKYNILTALVKSPIRSMLSR